jgi:sterol desaturase/sphingolipid hydroxylase (fatty acid hydroxylase superfamily)
MDQHPPSLLTEVFRLSLWLMALVVVFVPLERLFAVQPHRILRKETLTDLCYYFLNSLLPILLLGALMGPLARVLRTVVPGGLLEATAALPLWARLLAALVVGEVGYYWSHRLCHVVPFLWRFHAIHHSAEEMDFLVNSRAHPVDMVFSRFCALVPMYALGLSGPLAPGGTAVPVAVTLFGTAWGFFIHANLRWRFGPLEWLITTPAFHHWHHTRTGPVNRNYSSMLPWIDWIFGSLYLPARFPEDYGIKEKMPDALVDQLVHPLFPAALEQVEPAQAGNEPAPAPAAAER